MKLIFPPNVLLQHLIMLGKTGAGKSSALRHVVEHLAHHKKRFVVVDPKGDWYGLKWGADGKSAGLPVILFGEFKEANVSDIPINERSGEHLAELITSGNRPCVIGLSGWRPGQMTQFWIDLAGGLFRKNRGELYVVGDEFHNFAPKGKILSPQAGECLHWSNRMLSEGRGIGLVCLLASQRPQKVHNDTLTSCETLVAMRVVHKSDRDAVKDWIDGCGDPAQGSDVLKSLAGMDRGDAFVWSPEVGYGPERVKFPMFETFDSFAPPQLQKKVSSATWENVDLTAVKQKLVAVIEEAKANDPVELKRKLAETERKLRLAEQKSPEVKQAEPVEVPVFDDACRKLLEKVENACSETIEENHSRAMQFQEITKQLNTLRGEIALRFKSSLAGARSGPRPQTGVNQPRQREERAPVRPAGDVSSNGELDGAQQKIIDTIFMLRRRGFLVDREMLARWMGIHPNGGRYGTNLAYLRAEGYLDDLTPTDKVLERKMQTGIEPLLRILDGPKQEIINVLLDGNTYTRDELAARLGIHPNGGRFGTNLGWLRTMGVIPAKGAIKLKSEAYA